MQIRSVFVGILLFFLLPGWLQSAPMPVDKKYDELKLKNGRVLKVVTITNYNVRTGVVTYRMGKQLATIAIGQLPEAVAAELSEMAKGYKDESPLRTPRVSPQKHRAKTAAPKRAEAMPTAQPISEEDRLQRVAAAARNYASAHFRYRTVPDATGGVVTDPRLQFDDPVRIDGGNLYKVHGTRGVNTETDFSTHVLEKSREFEMEIEIPPLGQTKVVRMKVKD